MRAIAAQAGLKTIGTIEIVHDGKTVYHSKTRQFLKGYEKWRAFWTTRNRNVWTPRGLREGSVNPLILGFYLYQRLKEVMRNG